MWFILVISISNIDFIFNYMNNILIEAILVNRLNLHGPITNGIRASSRLFDDEELDNVFSFLNFNILVSATFNFMNKEIVLLEKIITPLLESESDTEFDNYISDEDFSFDRLEITSSDYAYDNTDWNYNSS